MKKEPSVAHGIPQWEQPQKMKMVSEQDDAPLIASPRRKPKESVKKVSAAPNAHKKEESVKKVSAAPNAHKKERPSQGGEEEPITTTQRRPSHMVISFNREDSCCLSIGDLTCDQSEIPLFQEPGNSVQQQRYSTAMGSSPVSSPRKKPNHLAAATSYQSPQKHRQGHSSPRRASPHRGSTSSPRKESHASSPRKASTRQTNPSSPRKPASAGRGGDIVLDVILPPISSQEAEGKKKKQPSSIQKPDAGEIVVNLSQATLSRESSDVVIPSFGSKSKTNSKKPDVSSGKKNSSGQLVSETDKPRAERSSKPGASFFPPAPLHESKNESRQRGSGEERFHSSYQERSSRRPECTTSRNGHDLSHSTTHERGPRRNGSGGGGGDELSHSSCHERSYRRYGGGGRDDLSYSSSHEQRRRGGFISSELSQSSSQDRKRASKSPPASKAETPSVASRDSNRSAKDAKSTTEITLDQSHMHTSSSSLMGGTSIEISIDCDSSDDGMARDTCNEETGLDAEDMALLEQENEMIKYAMEQSMQEFSVMESDDGFSVASGDGSTQSRQSECRSLHGAFRGKQKKLSESISRLISVEEPSDTEEDDDTIKMVIEMSRQSALTTHDYSVHGSKFPLNGESLAAIPATAMDDSMYSRFESADGLDASRISRFDDSHR